MAPVDADYNDLSQRLHEVLAKYSHFPKPILVTQCKRMGKTPKDLTRSDLPTLAEHIRTAIASLTNPQKAAEAKQAVLSLG